MDRSTDTIFDIQRSTGGSNTGVVAGFNDQARIDLAGQSQTAEGMEVRNDDFALEDMNDVGVIPDRFGGQGTASNSHPVESVAA